VARARRRWMREQGMFDPGHLVFIDETAANTKMVRLSGRCARGERLVGRVPNGHWKTITFLGALRRNGITAPCLAPKLQLQSRLVLPTGVTFGFFGGILGGIAAMPGPLVFIFLLAKGLRGKAFTKEASLYLVVSAGLLAIFLTASRQFSWLDVSVSTVAMLPVVLGMYVGRHMRDISGYRSSG
jgi:hypothetical protein